MTQGFTDRQLRILASPLDEKRTQRREQDGRTIFYIEGWYALAEANAIFGFDGWDRQTVHLEKLFERNLGESTSCGYAARVRITVRARGRVVVREGTGFGQVSGAYAAEAHEMAMKAAETDATKRALSTFGGRFGLLLYDKDNRGGVDRPISDEPRDGAPSDHTEPASASKIKPLLGRAGECRVNANASENGGKEGFTLATASGELWPVASAEGYCTGLRQLAEKARSQEELLALRRANQIGLKRLREIAGLATARGEHFADILERLLAKRARELRATSTADVPTGSAGKKPLLAVPAEMLEAGQASSLAHMPVPAALQDQPLPACTISEQGPTEKVHEALGEATPSEVESGGGPTRLLNSGDVADGAGQSQEYPAHFASRPETMAAGASKSAATQNGPEGSLRALAPAQDCPVMADSASESIKAFVPVPPYPLQSVAAQILNTRARGDEQNGLRSEQGKAELGSSPGAAIAQEPKQAPPPNSMFTPTRRSKISGGYSIDKSVLAVPSERRLRSKAHLVMVAGLPCLLCEEIPCHAHHITFAQPRGLSLKVSDEFAVPLCVKHHNEVHAKGREASWWRNQAIDPMVHARRLWLISAGLSAEARTGSVETQSVASLNTPALQASNLSGACAPHFERETRSDPSHDHEQE